MTQEMFTMAAKPVTEQVSEENLAAGLICPPQNRILDASLHLAQGVATYSFAQKFARVPHP